MNFVYTLILIIDMVTVSTGPFPTEEACLSAKTEIIKELKLADPTLEYSIRCDKVEKP